MQLKKLFIFALIPLMALGEEYELTSSQEELIGLEKTTALPEEESIFVGKVGEDNIPPGFETNDEKLDLSDIISTKQAATKKENSDEVVFYDYDSEEDAKSDISKLAQTTKVSGRVEEAINRELKNEKIEPKILDKNQLMAAYFSEDAPEVTEEIEQTNAKVSISGFEGKIDQAGNEKIFDFEFVPDYDSFNSLSDLGSGTIELKEFINASMGTIRGSILKRDYVRVKLDISLEKKDKFLEVPLISQEYFDTFLEKNQISGAGAHILIDLHESVKSVDIEADYEAKIFLDENFKKVEEGKERYVFFFGVTPGNVLLRVLDTSNEIGQKIINAIDGEIYFDQLGLVPGKMESVELYEKNILGKVNTELNIDGKDLKILNSDFSGKNVGINRYEYFRPTIPTGTRKYFELAHQNEILFMGIWNNLKVELPDRNFRSQILNQLNLRGLQESCLIQVNFSKPVGEFKANGEGNDSGIDVEIYYLGKDGLISSEVVENTTKAFILGNLPGVVNSAVKYLDGTKDFFISPCSQNSYLVEQF
jgi:hypothetical protein